MGFFSKMFGTKSAADTTDAEPRVDFASALSMHLRGEIDPAFSAYRKILEELPDDNLALLFASAITAGTGDTAGAAETLRSLSQRIALGGQTISRAISLDLVALTSDDPRLSASAIAGIIATFGDHLKKDGYLQESAVCYEIAAGLVPDNAHLLHKFGDVLHDLRMYDYAESVLREALKQAPNHWGALYTYAVLLHDLGRFPEAVTYYEQAVKLDPDHVKCRNNLGSALMMTNRLEEALAQCRVAAELDPGFPLAKINLGSIHLLMREYETARAYFTEALSLDGNLGQAYFGLGSVEQSLGGDTGRVRELYLKAIELNPSIPAYHYTLANVLAGDGNPEALSHFLAAAQLNDTLEGLQRDFGAACLQLGRREEALEHLRRALEQNPDDALAREILARAEGENPG